MKVARWIGVLGITLGAMVSAGQPPAAGVTVSQGTSMAVAVSPDGRQLAIDLQGSIWIVPREGGRATRITDHLHDARQPAWSPAGQRIAFQSYRNGTWDIWTIRPDGADAQPITSGPADDREPHWSPDGTRLAFSSDRDGSVDIWTVEMDGGRIGRVTRNAGNEAWPAWSADGREIAFVATGRPSPGVYAASLDGRERLLAAPPGTFGAPAWVPGADAVVFAALSDGRTRLLLGEKTVSSDEDVFPFRPQWTGSTPPGTRPAMIYSADGVIKERPDGGLGPARTIPFQADLPLTRVRYPPRSRDFDRTSPRRAVGLVRPNLSPDGGTLLFAALGDIWTARQHGRPVRITDDPYVDIDAIWSPDGKRIAYASDREGSLDIWVRDVSSGTERRITTATDPEMWPVWSPDGGKIAYVTVSGAANGQLWIADLETGRNIRLLGTTNGPISPGWAADGKTVFASVLRTPSTRFREGHNQIIAVPVDGGATRDLTLVADESSGKRGEGPSWSPDGRYVAAVLSGRLQIIPLDESGAPRGSARQVHGGAADQVSWSADSRRLVFSVDDRVMTTDVNDVRPVEWPVDLRFTPATPAGGFVIHAGRLVDGVSATARPNLDIVVERNRIARVVPHSAAEHAGLVVDGSDLTAIPGLMEGHGHYGADFGARFDRLHLAYGITSVRSPGGHPYASVMQRESVQSGRRPGPRLFLTGYLIDGSRVFYPMASAAPDEAAIDRELARADALGYDFIKTYVRLPDALQRRAIEGAHRIGIPVSSHEVYPSALYGADSVEHFSATSRRGYSPKISPLNRVYEDVVKIVAASGMTLTPTMALGRARPAILQSDALRSDPRWELQPAWVHAQFQSPPGPANLGQRPETLMAYHRAGVPIVAGTDSPLVPYAISLHLELEEYVAAGMTPLEALRTATINVARALRVDGHLGTIEAGKLADIVLVEGDPLLDIRNARNVRKVIVDGRLVEGRDGAARVP